MQTGFSPPSRSKVSSSVICAPPGTSSTSLSLAVTRRGDYRVVYWGDAGATLTVR